MNPIPNWFCTMFTIVLNNFNYCTNFNTSKLIKTNSTVFTNAKLPVQNNYSIQTMPFPSTLISDAFNSTVMLQEHSINPIEDNEIDRSKWFAEFANRTNQLWQTLFNYIDKNTGVTDSRFGIWISHQSKTFSLIILTSILMIMTIIIYVFVFKFCCKRSQQPRKRRYKNSSEKNIDERCYLLLPNSDDNMNY